MAENALAPGAEFIKQIWVAVEVARNAGLSVERIESYLRVAADDVHEERGGDDQAANELKTMMRDPRYWRDRDPDFIKQVSEGFSRLYAEHTS